MCKTPFPELSVFFSSGAGNAEAECSWTEFQKHEAISGESDHVRDRRENMSDPQMAVIDLDTASRGIV